MNCADILRLDRSHVTLSAGLRVLREPEKKRLAREWLPPTMAPSEFSSRPKGDILCLFDVDVSLPVHPGWADTHAGNPDAGPSRESTSALLACTPKAEQSVTPEMLKVLKDLRDVCVIGCGTALRSTKVLTANAASSAGPTSPSSKSSSLSTAKMVRALTVRRGCRSARQVVNDFDYCFSENGLTAYKLGKELASQSFIGHVGEDNYKKLGRIPGVGDFVAELGRQRTLSCTTLRIWTFPSSGSYG
jgi:hypothetical protein